jgi:hypothetical protein
MAHLLRTSRPAWFAALALLVVPVPVVGPVTAAAAPAPAGQNCAEPGDPIVAAPWPQAGLDPDRAWQFATGQGVRVGLLSSGVDSTHPQLRGHVQRGADFLAGAGTGPGDTDCSGIGTAVAGVIAAQPLDQVGFHGVARDAQIVPIAVANSPDLDNAGGSTGGNPGRLAAAIRWAIGKVDVLAVPLVTTTDDPQVRSAVQAALSAGLVIVASVGETGSQSSADPKPYPAGYAGVIGVGGVGPDGTLAPGARRSDAVDIVGPGAGTISTTRGGGLGPATGSAIATGYVAATVALLRQREPGLRPDAIGRRLAATATAVAADPGTPGFGAGLVDPYQAVTATASPQPSTPLPGWSPAAAPDPAAVSAAADRRRVERWAPLIAGGCLVAAVLGVLAVLVGRRARRRRWLAGTAHPMVEPPDDGVPTPPLGLFDPR